MASVSVPSDVADRSGKGGAITGRLANLARSVEGARSGRRQFDIRQALLVAGATLMGLGFVAIIFGWYGAAHSSYLFQEIPYLISGGLLGVALVAGGGFLFFAAWLVRLIEENRHYNTRVTKTLDRVDRALIAIASEAAQAAGLSGTVGGQSRRAPDEEAPDEGAPEDGHW